MAVGAKKILAAALAAIVILAAAWLLLSNGKNHGPVACTMEAMLCPDGSAVGRTGPDCEFAPCPDCGCPEGYRQDGAACNPECYYSNPPCLAPSVPCS